MNCIYCNTPFESKLYNKKACSQRCANRNRVSKWRIKTSKPCSICKINLVLKESTTCKDCHFSGRIKDWSSYTLQDMQELDSYQISARVRQDARKVYAQSKLPRECKICKYNNHIEIHHIQQIKSFPKSTKIGVINNLSNLVPLCRNHHWEVENDFIQL